MDLAFELQWAATARRSACSLLTSRRNCLLARGSQAPLRLLQPSLGAQAGWFLPLALIGLFALFDGGGAISGGVSISIPAQNSIFKTDGFRVLGRVRSPQYFFSVERLFNPYYLGILTRAVCALAGIGVAGLWREYRAPGWRGWLLPVAVLQEHGCGASVLDQFHA